MNQAHSDPYLVENEQLRQRIAELEKQNRQLQAIHKDAQHAPASSQLHEDTLRQRLSLFESFLTNAPALIVARDIQTGQILLSNAPERASCTGTMSASDGEAPLLLPAEVAAAWPMLDERVVQSQQAMMCEEVLHLATGKRFFELVKFPILDEQGTLYAVGSIIAEITRRKEAETALLESEEKYRTLFNTVPVGLYQATPLGKLLDVNSYIVQLLGYPDKETLLREPGHTIFIDVMNYQHVLDWIRENRATHTFERQVRCRDGTVKWVLERVRGTYDGQGMLTTYEGTMEDITGRKAYEAQIEHLSFTDMLTELPNRQRLYQVGEAALQDAERENHTVVLLYLDLDRFKAFNVSFGLDMGDTLLIEVAVRLQSCVRTGASVYRLGGDEFAMLLEHADETQAFDMAQQILEQIRKPFHNLQGQRLHLSASIGIAINTVDTISFSTLLTWADIAMYRAKAMGGGIEIYTPETGAFIHNQPQLESDLRWSLAADMLQLYYQPIQRIESDGSTRLICLEALLRWPHQELGLLGPDMFLPLAEESGLMRVLDSWVLGTALSQAATWTRQGYDVDVAINLSAYSLRDQDVVMEISDLLTVLELPPERVIIEVTERTALFNLDQTRHVLMGLKSLGLRIALDDFGSGYASLTYLNELPVDVLKLDRGFVAGIGVQPRNESMVRALLSLAREMQIVLVVEGVEEMAQLEWLQREDSQAQVQGFLLGRPMPPEQLDTVFTWSTQVDRMTSQSS